MTLKEYIKEVRQTATKATGRTDGPFSVVQTDNFDRELYPETLVNSNIESESAALQLAYELNLNAGPCDYYKVVGKDYVLFNPYE